MKKSLRKKINQKKEEATIETETLSLDFALEYLDAFSTSIAIFHLLDLGIYDMLLICPANSDEISESLSLNKKNVQALINFGHIARLLSVDSSGLVDLTEKGRKIDSSRGWFNLLVGGYGQTLLDFGKVSPNKLKKPIRNSLAVGLGSCQISNYGAFPLLTSFLNQLNHISPLVIADIGCGDGKFLIQRAMDIPSTFGYIVDTSTECTEKALLDINNAKLENRVKVINTTALDSLKKFNAKPPNIFVLSFVLHEILGAEGEKSLRRFLLDLVSNFPNAYYCVIEVDLKPTYDVILDSPMGRGYYNPYFWLHSFTNQELKPIEWWRNTFIELGLQIIEEKKIASSADPLGLEVGFLMK